MERRLQTSAALRDVLEKTKISTVEDLVYADLRRAGWNKSDAFYAAYWHIYSDYPMITQKQFLKHVEDDPNIKARINDSDNKLSRTELTNETSKEKVLTDLVLAKRRTREGSKEWIDLTKMIADYTKIKQDDIKMDDTPIRYYLPVKYPRRCDECLIYQQKKRKSTENLDEKE